MRKLFLLLALFIGSAQAALIDRGEGFIYDDILDITWAQQNGNAIGIWADQVAWVADLSIYDSVRDVTWDDWRLADMDLNGDDTIVDCSSATEVACRDNEFGYLFHHYGISGSSPGLFTNDLGGNYYWSSTEYAPNPTSAWAFAFSSGTQTPNTKDSNRWAWAVRDGDVASIVPIPAAAWLFASGLGLLGWMRIKTKSNRYSRGS